MKDIVKNSDLFVCDFCGSEQVDEKMWVDINNQLSIGGKWYAPVLGETDSDILWCRRCNKECRVVYYEEYMEGKDES